MLESAGMSKKTDKNIITGGCVNTLALGQEGGEGCVEKQVWTSQRWCHKMSLGWYMEEGGGKHPMASHCLVGRGRCWLPPSVHTGRAKCFPRMKVGPHRLIYTTAPCRTRVPSQPPQDLRMYQFVLQKESDKIEKEHKPC